MTEELKTEVTAAVREMDGRGWCTVDKGVHLAELIYDRQIDNAVEVGIFGGRSFIPMGIAMRHRGAGVCYGFDPMDPAAASEGGIDAANDEWWRKIDLNEMYDGFVKTVLHYRLTKECRWMRIRGEMAAKMFEPGTIGLLHLDSNHSEEASLRDVRLWLPKLRPGGVFVMDDTNWPSQQKALQTLGACAKLIGKHPNGEGCEYSVYEMETE